MLAHVPYVVGGCILIVQDLARGTALCTYSAQARPGDHYDGIVALGSHRRVDQNTHQR